MANSRTLLRRGLGQVSPPAQTDPQEVARAAYELYEQRGREDGHDFEDWLRAEAIVRARRASRAG